jgi:hypothetical protein
MHRSLGASLKQLTRFFDVQKNLSFFLENNNTINTYIHSNDKEPVQSKPISPSLIYNVTFLEFNENNLPNQKNNNSVSGLSGYVSFNSLFISLLILTSLNNLSTLFFPVFSHHRFKQYLNSKHVFTFLSLLSSKLSYPLIVDSTCTDIEFEKLLLHLAYGSSTSSLSFSNTLTDRPISQEEFVVFSSHVLFPLLTLLLFVLTQPSKSH